MKAEVILQFYFIFFFFPNDTTSGPSEDVAVGCW